MARPVVTAIMLEDLRREGAQIRLRRDALVTPAARDWLKEHAAPVTWVEPGSETSQGRLAAVMDASLPELRMVRTILERAGWLGELIGPGPGAAGLATAVERLCEMVLQRQAARGVVFVQDAALAVCLANKHAGIRAALGVNLPSVEEACRAVGINVLVLEYPRLTAYQTRQMIERLMSGPASAPAETAAMIQAIEQGGPRADR